MEFTETVLSASYHCYSASADLAQESSFPLYDQYHYMQSKFVRPCLHGYKKRLSVRVSVTHT